MIGTILAQPINENSEAIEAAIIASSAISVVGAASSPIMGLDKTGRLAGRYLATNFIVSLTLRVAAVAAFIAGLVLIIMGDDTTAAGIYTALSGTALGAVSMVVDRSVNRAADFSMETIKLEREEVHFRRVESILDKTLSRIQDVQIADETRRKISLNAANAITGLASRSVNVAALDPPESATGDETERRVVIEPAEDVDADLFAPSESTFSAHRKPPGYNTQAGGE
ncbi:hypothetical protein [Streptomyces sp. NPDC002962]|uniref:hypothetical protein n=1 Tax=Streptomyces sp. NPDC002962 TaxID=3364674 RepID=UPI0036846E04